MEEEHKITTMNFEQKNKDTRLAFGWVAQATRLSRSATRRPESGVTAFTRPAVPLPRVAFDLAPGQWPGGTGGSPVLPTPSRRSSRLASVLRCLLFKFVFAFFVLHFAFSASAQAPPQTGNRFLFIINTSSAMRRMTNGIQEAVFGLLNSGMQGQMRDGDTFGIWTYDDQLHTGFPMQVWSNQKKSAILQTVSNCLAAPRYQAKPHLEKVLPAALQLAEQSRVVTLIFIFDGSETMQGTGFDQDINDLQREFGRQTRADNVPFVTALAARDGKIFDYRVRTPSSASLPPTADYFKTAQTNAVPTVAGATNFPPPAVVVPQPPEPPRREIVLKPEPLPATNPPPVAAPATVEPVTPEKTEPVLPSENRSGARESAAVVQPAPTPPIQPAPAQAQPAPVPVQTPPPIAAPPNAPTNPQSAMGSRTSANPQSNEKETTEANKGNEGKQLPPSLPSFASVQNPQSSHGSTESRPTVESNPQSAIRNPQLATGAVAAPAPANHRALLAAAISLLAIAAILFLLLIRRSRSAPSLISQSMNRPR